MKQNHVLIEYENVQPAVAEALAQPVFKLWVFVGAQQAKVEFDMLDTKSPVTGNRAVMART